MDKEELGKRIEKKQKEIEKIEKRIAKWTTGMSEEAKKIAAACELVYDDPKMKAAYDAYKSFSETHEYDPKVFNQNEWNKGPQFSEAYRAYRDLAEAKSTLNKYITQVNKLTNFENKEKIKVIWDFLQDWKQHVIEFVEGNAAEYFELKKGYKEAYDNFKKENPDSSYRELRRFEENYWEPIHDLTKKVTDIKKDYVQTGPNYFDYKLEYSGYNINYDELNKILDKDVMNKYDKLINEITHITGEITDASGLSIGPKGDINGIVIGKEGKASVNTFGAGGWNIQVGHWRTRVTPVK